MSLNIVLRSRLHELELKHIFSLSSTLSDCGSSMERAGNPVWQQDRSTIVIKSEDTCSHSAKSSFDSLQQGIGVPVSPLLQGQLPKFSSGVEPHFQLVSTS